MAEAAVVVQEDVVVKLNNYWLDKKKEVKSSGKEKWCFTAEEMIENLQFLSARQSSEIHKLEEILKELAIENSLMKNKVQQLTLTICSLVEQIVEIKKKDQ